MREPSDAHISLLALLRIKGVSWDFVAREAQLPEGIDRLLEGRATEASPEAEESLILIRRELVNLEQHRDVVRAMLAATRDQEIRLTTVLDDDYPANLRMIFNLPAFLFYRGELHEDDARAVAVVGTRRPSDAGLARARTMATLLAEHGVTVLSGLARGIDTAAHAACLDAGGRTFAVLGTGIHRMYPPENADLAERIVDRGALVSQFWPDAPPTRYGFPRRNVVMSGLGQGTVVIEASSTSGAKMQARLALEHGKKVWLLRSLIETHEWARKYEERGAICVDEVDDIIGLLRSPAAVRERADARLQLTLTV